MDPNTNLREQLSLAAEILAYADSKLESDGESNPIVEMAIELAERVLALDDWIFFKGGFLPNRWRGR